MRIRVDMYLLSLRIVMYYIARPPLTDRCGTDIQSQPSQSAECLGVSAKIKALGCGLCLVGGPGLQTPCGSRNQANHDEMVVLSVVQRRQNLVLGTRLATVNFRGTHVEVAAGCRAQGFRMFQSLGNGGLPEHFGIMIPAATILQTTVPGNADSGNHHDSMGSGWVGASGFQESWLMNQSGSAKQGHTRIMNSVNRVGSRAVGNPSYLLYIYL